MNEEKIVYYTNAERAYDYSAVDDLGDTPLRFTSVSGQNKIRMVAMTRQHAERSQIPRYNSGLRVAYTEQEIREMLLSGYVVATAHFIL